MAYNFRNRSELSMSASGLRCAACWVMILAVPASSLWAAESAPAMLYAKGTAWINGGAVPRTSATRNAMDRSWQSHPPHQLYKSGILPQIVEIWIDLQVQHF